MKKHPSVYVVAGPNGAGKTTFALRFLPRIATVNFVNADMISAGLSPLKPESAALEASRVFLRRIRELADEGVDFAFETTLAGQAYAGLLQRMRDSGYRVHLLFLWIPSPELALRRVADRVRKGGHNIPEQDVRRRFSRGLRNLFSVPTLTRH